MLSEKLENLFYKDLEYIYNAVKLKSKILYNMYEIAEYKKLRKFYEKQNKINKKHIKQIEKIFTLKKKKLNPKNSLGAFGLLNEGNEIFSKKNEIDDKLFDYILMTYTQRFIHYEIASFHSLTHFARRLEKPKVLSILQKIAIEIKESDLILSDIISRKLDKELE